jgi:hypothetical protein
MNVVTANFELILQSASRPPQIEARIAIHQHPFVAIF